MNEVSTPNAPQPAGHYAQAIVHNGLVYVSGQLPVDPVTGDRRLGSIEEQADLLAATLKVTLPKGVGPLVEKLSKLGSALGGAA